MSKRKDLTREPGWRIVTLSDDLKSVGVVAVWSCDDRGDGMSTICVDTEKVRYWLHHDGVMWMNTRDYRTVPFAVMVHVVPLMELVLCPARGLARAAELG